MKVETGYLYHIKDSYFDKVNDNGLMINHENGKTRPTYFTIKDGEILWFIPLSTKISKYQKIIYKKIEKFGECKSIMIRTIADKKSAILLQNAFPTLTKYIDHVHLENGKPLKVIEKLKNEVLINFNSMLALHKQGKKVFFADIDKLKQMMLDELKEDLN